MDLPDALTNGFLLMVPTGVDRNGLPLWQG